MSGAFASASGAPSTGRCPDRGPTGPGTGKSGEASSSGPAHAGWTTPWQRCTSGLSLLAQPTDCHTTAAVSIHVHLSMEAQCDFPVGNRDRALRRLLDVGPTSSDQGSQGPEGQGRGGSDPRGVRLSVLHPEHTATTFLPGKDLGILASVVPSRGAPDTATSC